jgi:hypothetical protein
MIIDQLMQLSMAEHDEEDLEDDGGESDENEIEFESESEE